MQFAEKHFFSNELEKFMSENPIESLAGQELKRYESKLAAAKLKWIADVSIGTDFMSKLMAAFGITLNEQELEDLVGFKVSLSAFIRHFSNNAPDNVVCQHRSRANLAIRVSRIRWSL